MKQLLTLLIIPGFLLSGCKKNPGEENSPDYTITVTYDYHGTASADKQTAKKGETVMLTANPGTNYELEKWTVESGDATLQDAEVNSATFTMPAGDVSVRASFSIIFPDDIFTAITDPAFKEYCEQFDTDGDGILSPDEAAAVTEINPYLANIWTIVSLDGIQYFTNLELLVCGINYLLNVSNNMQLTDLHYRNKLTSLDISNNTKLTRLYCSNNQLETLDTGNCPQLTELDCNSNQLMSIDVSGNTQLTYLSCNSNQLMSIDISNNTKLTQLYCSNNQLETLDISNRLQLTYLGCKSNKLTSIDVSGNTQLTYLNCGSNKLKSLDISKNTKLIRLYCNNDQLETLDISNCLQLTDLDCGVNQLTSLDVSNNKQLTDLDCNNNDLISLDVSNNTRLTTLVCNLNPLTEIIVWNDFDLENPSKSIETILKDDEMQFVKK